MTDKKGHKKKRIISLTEPRPGISSTILSKNDRPKKHNYSPLRTNSPPFKFPRAYENSLFVTTKTNHLPGGDAFFYLISSSFLELVEKYLTFKRFSSITMSTRILILSNYSFLYLVIFFPI